MNNRRWSEEEDKILIDQIQENANNIQNGIRKAAEALNRSESACEYRWYAVLLKRKNTAICLTTVGKYTRNPNRKNVSSRTSDNTERHSSVWWKKFLTLLGLKK